jgi:putative hydrolase of the HAD superfamily
LKPMRTIILDFGNVVGFFDHRLVTRRLRPWGEFDPDEFHARIFGGEVEDAYEAGRMTSAEFLGYLREQGRLTCDDDVLTACYNDIFWPNPEVAELVPRLRPRYQLLLASNTTPLHSERFREQFAGTLGHFHSLVLSHDVGARKPTAVFYEECIRRSECPAADCVFIDDLPANVEGAVACGLVGLVYRRGELRRDLEPLGVTFE